MKVVHLIIFTLWLSLGFAQIEPEFNGDKTLANEYFEYANFRFAQEEYKILYAQKPKKIEYNYRLGVCYLNTQDYVKLAIPLLEFVTNQPDFEPRAMYELAKAYHRLERFDDAIKAFEKYNELTKGQDSIIVDKQIQFCLNGKELIKYPLNVAFENLGKDVNSEFTDKLPFVSDVEDEVFFTTKRYGTTSRMLDYDGQAVADVFSSKVRTGNKWRRPRSASPYVNSELPEEIVYLSRNNRHLIYNRDNFGTKDLYMSEKEREYARSFPRAHKLSLNTTNNDYGAAITEDGHTLIFASDREGGYGGLDLYICKRLPTGAWGQPINMGPTINTPFNENYPTFSPEKGVLYFASEGHTSMGGYDVFKTYINKWSNRWNQPENIGYPLNTTNDDYNICFDKTMKYAYVAQVRPLGYGDYDIYRVNFKSREERLTVINGILETDSLLGKVADSLKNQVKRLEAHIKQIEAANPDNAIEIIAKKRKEIDMTQQRIDYYNPVTLNDITVIDKVSNTVFGRYKPNEKTGRYVIILPPGIYELKIKNVGFKDYNEVLQIHDKVYYQSEIEKNIYLQPIPETIPYKP